jgi:hypothetical protein
LTQSKVEFRLTEPHIRIMSISLKSILIAVALWAAVAAPVAAADIVFPIASRLGMAPPAGFKPGTTFPGFEDTDNNAFIRLIALPGPVFAEVEKSLSNDAIKKQGMTVERRDSLTLAAGNASIIVVNHDSPAGRLRKWLVVAPVDNLTAMVSIEMPAKTAQPYSDEVIRLALTTLTARASIPSEEQLQLVPFRVGDTAGFRLVRVAPGTAAQFTDGPKDSLDAFDQPHVYVSAARGGPQQPGDRHQFARDTLSDLPPMKDVRITSAETMRIGGQSGHEIRANGKDPNTGAEIEIVQWLRFGTGAYLRILGIGPKENWTETFMRFRAVREGIEPR